MAEIGEGGKITRLEFFKKAKEGAKLVGVLGLVGLLMELARRSTEKTEKDFPEIGYYKGEVTVPKGTHLRRLPIADEETGEPSTDLGELTEDLEIENPKVVETPWSTTTKFEGKKVEGKEWLKFETEIKGKKTTVFAFKLATKIDPEAEFIEFTEE